MVYPFSLLFLSSPHPDDPRIFRASPTEPYAGHGGQIDVGLLGVGQSCPWCWFGWFGAMTIHYGIECPFASAMHCEEVDFFAITRHKKQEELK